MGRALFVVGRSWTREDMDIDEVDFLAGVEDEAVVGFVDCLADGGVMSDWIEMGP